jgi:DegV family protein with EDD domain
MGSPRVAVVTDSTAYLPPGLADSLGVVVVPLQVVLDGRAGDEGLDVTPRDVVAALSGRRPGVTTSRPSPRRLAHAYAAAAEAAGVDSVVAVHLSQRLSGTVDAAQLAALDCGALDVRVVDSGSVAMGLGFAVIAAAEAAARGEEPESVVQAAKVTAARTSMVFYVDTLEHLRRGGRIGKAQALLGAALAVKPLLHLVDGEIALREKVRTSTRAIARMEDIAVEVADAQPVHVAVHHLGEPEKADMLADRLQERVAAVGEVYVSEVGAVVGTHVGPGLLGVVVAVR